MAAWLLNFSYQEHITNTTGDGVDWDRKKGLIVDEAQQ